ncbi:MAG: hypothetical protein JWO42_742 [Chloroflexi bacterium]|nr:hypothetical protein [Chloroflexota bacterium]
MEPCAWPPAQLQLRMCRLVESFGVNPWLMAGGDENLSGN